MTEENNQEDENIDYSDIPEITDFSDFKVVYPETDPVKVLFPEEFNEMDYLTIPSPLSGTLSISIPNESHSIIFNSSTHPGILKIDHGSFYVRGVKVPQDENEAQLVYNTFKEFLGLK